MLPHAREIDDALKLLAQVERESAKPAAVGLAQVWAAYRFCVLEWFHRRLKHRDICAPASSRWNDPL